jgi:hypothetical protein
MSLRSVADGPAAWEHGLTPVLIKRLRILIRPFDTPPTLAFDPERYARLYNASPGIWSNVLSRYALFQRLRRRENETEADHHVRQTNWLGERRQWEQEQRTFSCLDEYDVRTMLPHDPANGAEIALGTWIASPEQIAGSKLEYTVPISPTGRVLVIDIASDKAQLLARISELIDREREASGIAAATRRGPETRADKKLRAMQRIWPNLIDNVREGAGLQPGQPCPDLDWRPDRSNSEHREFLKSIQDHRVVPLWDLQLAGLATNKLATARVLYTKLTDPARNVTQRSIPRVLLQKIGRARELQDQIVRWLPRLRAVVG